MSKYLNTIKSTKHLCKNNLLKHEVLQTYFSNIKQTDSSINSTDSTVKNSTTSVQILENDIDVFLKKDMKISHALDECQEDVSFISAYIQPTFNFASLANKNKTIQELVKLGVALYKIEEKKGGLELLLKSSFEEDVKPYIQFLNDCGLPAEKIGKFLTQNPFIIQKDLDDLKTRVRYLRAHNFTPEMIVKIVDVNPYWLSYSTKQIDERLGWFQVEFELTGDELRQLIFKNPRLGTYKHSCLVATTFSVREEMGFEPWEVKQVLFNQPQLWELGILNSLFVTKQIITIKQIILFEFFFFSEMENCRGF